MRSKEEAHDYRYFPEPDLMPMEIDADWVHQIRETMIELPTQKKIRYIYELGLSEYDTDVIVNSIELAHFFDKIIDLKANVKAAVNWLMGDITAYLNEKKSTIDKTELTPESLVEMLSLIDKGVISNNIAKKLIIPLMEKGGSVKKMVEDQGLSVISDEGALKNIVIKILENNKDSVEKYKSGKLQLFGFFVGQVMKETKGRANPETVNKLLKEALDGFNLSN